MRQSKLFLKTQKLVPKDEVSVNARLLIRAGFVDKLTAGSYSFLPLGLRVLRNIENIVREEMNALNAEELSLPLLNPRGIWDETGRWESADEIMFKTEKGSREYALAFTHEEAVMDLLRKRNVSYRDLPVGMFQFTNKFRNEPRARSGLLRGIEFRMKDLYSVHESEEDMRRYYNTVLAAYTKVFGRMGLQTKIAEAAGGVFTRGYTHEFQVLSEAGEDTVYFCTACDWAQNKEIAAIKKGDKCPECGGAVEVSRAIEVGNTFPLGTFYSEKMEATFTDRDGEKKPFWFASYGIGTSRLVGAIVEVSHDEQGIIWPESVSPYRVHLILLNQESGIGNQGETIYKELAEAGIEVLYDERADVSSGEKLAEADLIGIPYRAIVSEKTIGRDGVELKRRDKETAELVPAARFVDRIKKL